MNPSVLLLLAVFAAPTVVAIAGAVRPRLVPSFAIAMTALAFLVTLWTLSRPASSFDVSWASTWNLRFHIAGDGLARMYALLATGIGLAVVTYASRYMRLHLHHDHRPDSEQTRFFAFLLLFMAAMVGLVMAQDLVLIFLFWDLTAIASYFLIGFDRGEEESRSSAQMALLVTGISAVLVLIGFVLLWTRFGTWSLPEIIAQNDDATMVGAACVLIAIGALAKSAQVPLHFWLPRAMAAPTPVSAYLHSAAMVAAGVFMLGRFYPLIERFDLVLNGLVVVGFLSILVGGVLALTRNVLKQVLAYSTISQYGYVVVMFGLGGEHGVAGATFYVLAHALVKSALFLTAGAVTEATGKKYLPDIGGLARQLPLLAVGSALAAAGLVALPGTIGFFKDELFFTTAREHGSIVAALTVLAAALTFGYIFRFWWSVFMGEERSTVRPISGWLVWPVVVLGALAVTGGWWLDPVLRVVEPAATVSWGTDVHLDVAYHLDARAENLMALGAWAIGLIIYATRSVWWGGAIGIALIGERLGPAHWYFLIMNRLNALSDSIHRFEVRDLRSRVASILLPAGVLVVLAVIFTPNANAFRVGDISPDEIPVITMFIAIIVSAVVVCVSRDHFRISIALSSAGFSLAAVYAFIGAPDVTVVAIVVETMMSIFLLGMLVLMPSRILRFETEARFGQRHLRRDVFLALVAGTVMFFVAWGALSRPSTVTSVIDAYDLLTPQAHGKAVVTVILADFRGFDTLGEIMVIAVTLLGVISLLRSGRLR